jgi:hypothetical protein
MYVDSKKANLGKDFFRQLIINSDISEEVNPDNICNLMHFLFQQASINNKSITFTEGFIILTKNLFELFILGMFIIFDSSNQIFNRLIKSQKSSNNLDSRDYPLRYVERRNINTSVILRQTSENLDDDRYPTYGMDIPGSCILFLNCFS